MRFENNELGLDEVVLKDCFFHLERMNDRSFWIGVEDKLGDLYHINIYIERGKMVARMEKQ